MIEVNDIAVSYRRGSDALCGVSMSLRSGEMVAVLGANGAGKSTLLRALSGLIALRRGSISLDGRDISRAPAHQRVEMGLVHVPEMRQMLSGLSVEENLLMGAYVKRRDRNWVADAIAEVYQTFPILRERRHQIARSLSGGEQQMVAIGRALMAKPAVLMCDEPSLGLAPMIVKDILRELGRLRDRGIPILLVEQNARKALEIADRAVVLKRGEMVLSGSAAELRSNRDVKAAYLGIA
jgi:branched-chain amino acid transport system ATP-binding protein